MFTVQGRVLGTPQVLHSQMLASSTSLNITLHLSVVPPATLTKERQLIAAIRFAVEEASGFSE